MYALRYPPQVQGIVRADGYKLIIGELGQVRGCLGGSPSRMP